MYIECSVCENPIHHLGDGVFTHTMPEGDQPTQISWVNKQSKLPCWLRAQPVYRKGYCGHISCTGEDRQYVADVEIGDSTYKRCEAHIPLAEEVEETSETTDAAEYLAKMAMS